MPAEGAERAGETTADRAGGVDADQVQVACFTLEQGQYFVQCGQGVFLQAMAVPGAFVQAQVRVDGQQRQGLAQLLQGCDQALAI
ncbi:hypothetical protein D9M71_616390 [compost metagenome]